MKQSKEENDSTKYTYYKFSSSSVLDSAAWSQDKLVVIFKSGSIWMYHDVSDKMFKEMISAPSAGKYFNLNIRNSVPADLIYKKESQLVAEA